MSCLYESLKDLFVFILECERDIFHYEMVLSSGELTEEEAALLAEGPTLSEVRRALKETQEEVERLLGQVNQVPDSLDNVI